MNLVEVALSKTSPDAIGKRLSRLVWPGLRGFEEFSRNLQGSCFTVSAHGYSLLVHQLPRVFAIWLGGSGHFCFALCFVMLAIVPCALSHWHAMLKYSMLP